MYRIPLGNIEMHIGPHKRRSESGTYSWTCGCTARRDSKCENDQPHWEMCQEHFNKE